MPITTVNGSGSASCNIESTIVLMIRTLDGSEMTIDVPSDSTTVGELRAMIRRKKGESRNCDLILNSQVLSDDSATLSAMGVGDKVALSLCWKREWKLKRDHVVKAEARSFGMYVAMETEHTYMQSGEQFDVSKAKARCEKEDWAGFVLKGSLTRVLHTGLADWGDGYHCNIYYFAKPFRESSDAVPIAAEASESSSGVSNTCTTHDLYYLA